MRVVSLYLLRNHTGLNQKKVVCLFFGLDYLQVDKPTIWWPQQELIIMTHWDQITNHNWTNPLANHQPHHVRSWMSAVVVASSPLANSCTQVQRWEPTAPCLQTRSTAARSYEPGLRPIRHSQTPYLGKSS
jgi:hypothetical protein